jgi:hypothetical protein
MAIYMIVSIISAKHSNGHSVPQPADGGIIPAKLGSSLGARAVDALRYSPRLQIVVWRGLEQFGAAGKQMLHPRGQGLRLYGANDHAHLVTKPRQVGAVFSLNKPYTGFPTGSSAHLTVSAPHQRVDEAAAHMKK